MANVEQAVRDAANALQGAITDARKAGYAVAWPGRPEDLGAIAISETAKVGGQPIVGLTDEDRAALPRLGAVDPNEAPVFGIAPALSSDQV
jgi:hypothetical protein